MAPLLLGLWQHSVMVGARRGGGSSPSGSCKVEDRKGLGTPYPSPWMHTCRDLTSTKPHLLRVPLAPSIALGCQPRLQQGPGVPYPSCSINPASCSPCCSHLSPVLKYARHTAVWSLCPGHSFYLKSSLYGSFCTSFKSWSGVSSLFTLPGTLGSPYLARLPGDP